MMKSNTFFLILIFCSTAFAEPVLYICERPAWEGKDGCGANNTYYTYNFFVETDDFSKKNPLYDLQKRKGCDASKAAMWSNSYRVNEETITFWFKQQPGGSHYNQLTQTIKLDRKTLKAVISKVKHSSELTCRQEKGEDRKPGTSPSRRGYRLSSQ